LKDEFCSFHLQGEGNREYPAAKSRRHCCAWHCSARVGLARGQMKFALPVFGIAFHKFQLDLKQIGGVLRSDQH